jgi:hypothetical protein
LSVQQPYSSGALAEASRYHVPVVIGYPIIACSQFLRTELAIKGSLEPLSFASFQGQCHTLERHQVHSGMCLSSHVISNTRLSLDRNVSMNKPKASSMRLEVVWIAGAGSRELMWFQGTPVLGRFLIESRARQEEPEMYSNPFFTTRESFKATDMIC